MFELLTVKSKKIDSKIDLGFICEALLFYKTVNLFAQKDELVQLFSKCSILGIEKLIDEERLNIHIQEQFLGPMIFPNGSNPKYKIESFSSQTTDKESTLYQVFHEITGNSSKSVKLTDLFSAKTSSFKYSDNLIESIYDDLHDKNYTLTILAKYLNELLPELQVSPVDIEFNLEEGGAFEVFENTHTIKTNLDLEKIKKSYQSRYNEELKEIFSGFFLTLAEAKGDLDISSKFQSEIATKKIHSEFITSKINQLFYKPEQHGNIIQFNEKILHDYKSIGEAINCENLSFSTFLKLLDKSNNFRRWLHNSITSSHNDQNNLIEEYYKELAKESIIDKLPSKSIRFLILESLGFALDATGLEGIGKTIATGLSIFDTFIFDKIAKGWKPNHFINDTLIPNLPKK